MKAIDVWVVSCYTFVCVALAEVILLYFVAKRITIMKQDEIELVVSINRHFLYLGDLAPKLLFYFPTTAKSY